MDKFYVFSVNTNGHFFKRNEAAYKSYGSMFGSGNLETEARKLKERYSNAESAELVIVDSHSWSPVIAVKSIGDGMSGVDIPIPQNIKAIIQYLLTQGISEKEAKVAVKIMEKQGLQFQDMVSNDVLFGMPFCKTNAEKEPKSSVGFFKRLFGKK